MIKPAREPGSQKYSGEFATLSTALRGVSPSDSILADYATLMDAEGQVRMMDVSEGSTAWEKVTEDLGIIDSTSLLAGAAQVFNLRPLFGVRLYTQAPDTVCEVCVLPKVSLKELWTKEALLFVSQHDPERLNKLTRISERSFSGNYVFESVHSNVTSDYEAELFTPWGELRSSRDEAIDDAGAPIRYADVMTDSLSFWVEESQQDGRTSAGLIVTLPFTDRQIGGISKFLHAAGGEELSVEVHEKLVREMLFDKIPAAIASNETHG